jgi:hypothetical protein
MIGLNKGYNLRQIIIRKIIINLLLFTLQARSIIIVFL